MPSFIEREQLREFQPYQTPIDQIAKTFQTKLEYWKTGASQIKLAYQNYLGLDLTNSKNQEGLAEYMKTAKQEIQKANQTDFSIGENVTNIIGVFDNLTNGKTEFSRNIMADHAVTTNWNSSLQKAESSRYNNNGKDFNQASVDAIQRQKELFRQGDGSYNSSMIASSMMEKYNPYYNTLAEEKTLTELFEADINDSTTPNGQGYLIHKKDASWKAEKLKEFINTNASDKFKQQIATEARAEFYNHKLIAKRNPDLVLNAYQDTFDRAKQAEITEYQNKVNQLNSSILTLDPKDPEYSVKKNILTQNIKSVQNNIESVNQRTFNPNLILSNDYREGVNFAESLKWNEKTNNFAQSFAHQNTVEETKMDQGYFAAQNLNLARSKFNFQVSTDARDFAYNSAKDARDFNYEMQRDYSNQLIKLMELGITPSQDFLNQAKSAGVDLGNISNNSSPIFTPAGTSTENADSGTFNSETGEYVYKDGRSVNIIDYQRSELLQLDKSIQNSYRDAVIGAFGSLGNFGNKDAEKVEEQLKMLSSPTSTTQWQDVGSSGYSSGAIEMFSKLLNIPASSVSTMSNSNLAKQIDTLFTSKDGHNTLKKMIENGQIPNLEIGSFTSTINRQLAVKKALAEDAKENIVKTLLPLGITINDVDDNLRITGSKLRQAFTKDREWLSKNRGVLLDSKYNASGAQEQLYQKWYQEKVLNPLRSKTYSNNIDPKAFQNQRVKMDITLDKAGNLTPQSKASVALVNESLYDFAGSGGNQGATFQPYIREIITTYPQLVKEWVIDGNNLIPRFNREVFSDMVKKGNPNDKDATSITLSGLELTSERLNALEKFKIPIKTGTTLSSQIDPLKINTLRLGREINIPIEGDYDNIYGISLGNASNTSAGNNQEQSIGYQFKLPSITFKQENGKSIFNRDSQGNIIMESNNSDQLKRANPREFERLQRGINITPTKTVDLLQQGATYQLLLRDYLNSPEGKNINSVEELPVKYKQMLNLSK